VVHLWRECGGCDGLLSVKPVGGKVSSAEAGVIWPVMIWALAQAGNRAGKTRHHCAVMRLGAQARLHTWTRLSPHDSTFSLLAPRCFSYRQAGFCAAHARLMIRSCSFVGVIIVFLFGLGCFLTAAAEFDGSLGGEWYSLLVLGMVF
jgi:hypothetical protein